MQIYRWCMSSKILGSLITSWLCTLHAAGWSYDCFTVYSCMYQVYTSLMTTTRTDMTHGPTYSSNIERYGLLHCKSFHLLMPLFVAWLTPSLARVRWSYWSCLPTNGYVQRWGKARVKSDGKRASSVHTTLVYMSLQSTWCATPAWSNV